jgi:hypothetical protein
VPNSGTALIVSTRRIWLFLSLRFDILLTRPRRSSRCARPTCSRRTRRTSAPPLSQ